MSLNCWWAVSVYVPEYDNKCSLVWQFQGDKKDKSTIYLIIGA